MLPVRWRAGSVRPLMTTESRIGVSQRADASGYPIPHIDRSGNGAIPDGAVEHGERPREAGIDCVMQSMTYTSRNR